MKNLFLKSKEFVFYIILTLILIKNKKWKKWHFFVQKHGLTPLEKCDLWDLQKFLLL